VGGGFFRPFVVTARRYVHTCGIGFLLYHNHRWLLRLRWPDKLADLIKKLLLVAEGSML
jgi:hypothetical protein